MKDFNIEGDKSWVVGYMKWGEGYNGKMSLWICGWSGGRWMKMNEDYGVGSDKYNRMEGGKDYYLEGNKGGKREGVLGGEVGERDLLIEDGG